MLKLVIISQVGKGSENFKEGRVSLKGRCVRIGVEHVTFAFGVEKLTLDMGYVAFPFKVFFLWGGKAKDEK